MLLIMLIALLALIFIGVPIVLCMGVVGLAGMLLLPDVNPALFPQRMFGMLDTYALLALPYFILAGSLMAHGGLSLHLVRFARTLVGHFQAGLCHASIVSSMVFAGVSGSSTADASAIGSVVIPTMKGNGYKPGFAAALIACAGTIGAIIPPSMVMVIYGSMAQVSIGGLFLGGIVPGVLVGLFLMATVKIHTYLPGFPELRVTTARFDLCEVWRALIEVWPALLAPLVILGGILTGVFTATEAGLVACFYAFLVSKFVYKQLHFKNLPRILLDAAVTTSMVSGIIAMAGGLGWLLAYLEFNDIMIKLLTSVTTSKTGILVLLTVIMLILTMFVEIDGNPDHLRAGRGLCRIGFQCRSVPAWTDHGDVEPDRIDHAAGRRAALCNHQHRRDHLRPDRALRLAVHRRRVAGLVSGGFFRTDSERNSSLGVEIGPAIYWPRVYRSPGPHDRRRHTAPCGRRPAGSSVLPAAIG